MDIGIKQPAIKSLLGCKTLEKFTIKRPVETEKTKPEGGELFGVQICGSKTFTQTDTITYNSTGRPVCTKVMVFSTGFKEHEYKEFNHHKDFNNSYSTSMYT